jgi:hypothetical protein
MTIYLKKGLQIPITIFHTFGSRLKNQTTNIRRRSSLFFSGELTLADDKYYLELYNLSFLKGQTQALPTTTSLPWSNATTSGSSTSQIMRTSFIHQEPKTPESTKRKSQRPFQPNKILKLTDIVINAIANKDDSQDEEDEKANENVNDQPDNNPSEGDTQTDDEMVANFDFTCEQYYKQSYTLITEYFFTF